MDAPGRTADVFAWQRSALDSASTVTTGMWRMWSDAVKQWSDGNGSSDSGSPQRKPPADPSTSPDAAAEGLGAVVWNRVLRSSRVYMRFAEFWFEFLKGIPALEDNRDPGAVFGRWAQLYGDLFDQVVGSPQKPRRDAALPWLGLLTGPSGAYAKMWSAWWPMLGDVPQQMMRAMTGAGRQHDPVSLLSEVVGETLGKVFAAAPGAPETPLELAQRSRDAFLRFQQAVPAIYQLFYSAGVEALREFLARVGEAGIEAIAAKPLRDTYRMWWTANENAFQRLFQMPDFGRALNDVLSQSLDLKQRTDDMAADWCKRASVPTRADFDELAAVVHELRRKVRQQEQDIQSLQEQLAASRPKRRGK